MGGVNHCAVTGVSRRETLAGVGGGANNNNNKIAAAAGLPALFGDICVGVALGPRALDFVPYPTAFVLLGELGLCLHALEVVGCGGRSCPTETHRDRVGE